MKPIVKLVNGQPSAGVFSRSELKRLRLWAECPEHTPTSRPLTGCHCKVERWLVDIQGLAAADRRQLRQTVMENPAGPPRRMGLWS